MLKLPGSSALSAFRVARLLARLQTLEPAVGGLQAQYLHFVDHSERLDASGRLLLERLLNDGQEHPPMVAPAAPSMLLLVVPRPARFPRGRARPPISRRCADYRQCDASSAVLSTASTRRAKCPLPAARRWRLCCTTG